MQLTRYNSKFLTYLIFSVCTVLPFSNDGYLASLPDIAHSLATTHTSWIMSFFMFSSAISQIFYGPFLDRFGRRPVLIFALTIFCIGSFITLLAPSLSIMLIARIIQAIGASCCIVATLTIIKDIYPKEEILKMTAFTMGIIAICPNIAPIIGGVLQSIGGWKLSFGLFLVMGVVYLILISSLLEETHQTKNLNALKFKQIIFTYFELMRHKKYFGYLATSGCSYSALFSYFAIAPFLIVNLFKINEGWVGVIIAINSIPLLITPTIYTRLIRHTTPSKSIIIGSSIILIGAVIMFIINLLCKNSLLTLIGPMFISSIGIGIIRPNASAGYMQLVDKKVSGSASALFGFFSFFSSAIFTTAIGEISINSVLPFAIFLITIALLGILASNLTKDTTCPYAIVN